MNLKMVNTNKKYYLGGYYLIKLKPKNYGSDEGSLIYTCSDCINDHLLDIWAYSWTTDNEKQAAGAKINFQISDTQVNLIRNWVDSKHNDNRIGWTNVFTDFKTALEYKSNFFSHLSDIKILALYFDETQRTEILEELKTETEKMGEIGLQLTLLNGIVETDDDKFLGYDYIGIETGGSFHTFHCHDIGKELSDKFSLTLNEFGLFNSNINSEQVLDYLNDENNGCAPVPWFIAKTKLL